MNCDDLIRMMEKARELGVTELEMDGMRLKFRYKPIRLQTHEKTDRPTVEAPPPVPEMKVEDIVKPLSPLDEMSPEEILYYATPYYDEMQAQKQAQADKLVTQEP